MAPKTDSKREGVVYRDDNGKVLGVAPHNLNSDDGLAYLGYVADPEADGGVRRIEATTTAKAAAATRATKPAAKRGR
ncbi:MAG: hypothetical protein EPO65_06755 [Dehalococcoidia bacterium]|nr:MAG: hypothetical protein EPO65_06755 [Dehalococcoidia bacterium]